MRFFARQFTSGMTVAWLDRSVSDLSFYRDESEWRETEEHYTSRTIFRTDEMNLTTVSIASSWTFNRSISTNK